MTIGLREDFDAAQARSHAARCDDANQARWLWSIGAVDFSEHSTYPTRLDGLFPYSHDLSS